MRITGGTLVGRRLEGPPGPGTRATADRVREGLFNILVHHAWPEDIGDPLTDARVLDAFCGTGALACEALSRGAASAILFDKAKTPLNIAGRNLLALGLADRATALQIDATRPPVATSGRNAPWTPCTLIFLDPPYRKNLVAPALESLAAHGWIAPHALAVVETAKTEDVTLPLGWTVLDERRYGDTRVTFAGRADEG